MFTSLSSRACERKWRKDHVTGRRQPNRSQSFRSVPISDAGMITTAAVNSAVWTMVCHFALKTDPVSCVRTGCQKPGLHKPRLRHRRIVARPLPLRKQRRKQVRPWTIRWSYTHQKTLYRLLPSVSSPKIRPRPSGRKQPQVPLNPSPWLPASRRWDGPAPTGQTTAGRGRLNIREDTARKNVTSLRDISRHAVTATAATGERASGPGQVPLVGPARVDVPSAAVSLRRRTPVRRALPLAIIIILRAIVHPSHHLHHGRLQTPRSQPSHRERRRESSDRTGGTFVARQDVQLFPAKSKAPEKRTITVVASPARQIHVESAREVSVPAPVADGSAGAGPAASDGSATGDGPAVRNGTATDNDPTTGDGSATGNGPAAGDGSATGTARPQWTARPQLMTRPMTTQQMSRWGSHLKAQTYVLMIQTNGPAPLPAAGVDGLVGQGNPAATPVGGPDVSSLTGTSTPSLFPSMPKTIDQSTLVDFISMWTLLQRRLDQPSVQDNSSSPPVQSSLPAPGHDSTNRRSVTLAGSPERRPKSPERFLHTPQSSISSLVRRAKEAERQARTPVRPPRTPVRRARNHSESRDSRSRSPLSRSSSVESTAQDESPLNFNAALDVDSKRAISED